MPAVPQVTDGRKPYRKGLSVSQSHRMTDLTDPSLSVTSVTVLGERRLQQIRQPIAEFRGSQTA